MNIDCHVHICAFTPGHGSMSDRLINSIAFRFMRWRLGLPADRTIENENRLEALLARLLDESDLDAAVVLAFDGVHDRAGNFNADNTHLYVTNDYVIELASRNPKYLLGASIHPYRTDAVAEIEKCVKAGAVLLKWLPIVQDFNPADRKCLPVYEALAHYDLPLLCHTGGEKSLPNMDVSVADPNLLKPALDMGVKVIMAHCGTASAPGETDYVPEFMKLAREYEHCYGDTAALNLPTRWYAYGPILNDPIVRKKLIHGSDWPILPLPNPMEHPLRSAWGMMRELNWLQRDIVIKRGIGFDAEYWGRAADVLQVSAITV
jgi:predicted TIM-barrel fold metal-dependent hydrolase